MNPFEALRVVNLIAFTALLATSVAMWRLPQYRGWGVSVGFWALNNIAFYLVLLFTRLDIESLNAWSAVTKLHGAVLVIGGMIIISTRKRT